MRAIVDDDYALVRTWRGNHYGWEYKVLTRLTVETFNATKPKFFEGGLPRGSTRTARE